MSSDKIKIKKLRPSLTIISFSLCTLSYRNSITLRIPPNPPPPSSASSPSSCARRTSSSSKPARKPPWPAATPCLKTQRMAHLYATNCQLRGTWRVTVLSLRRGPLQARKLRSTRGWTMSRGVWRLSLNMSPTRCWVGCLATLARSRTAWTS